MRIHSPRGLDSRSIVPSRRLLRLVLFSVAIGCLIAPTSRAATNITILATGTGNLDSFLSASNGTITTANDPGDTAATLSKAALLGVGPGVPISIAADTSITFQDVGTLTLQTGLGSTVTFQTTSGAIAFMNTSDTLSTSGATIQFNAGTNLTVCGLNSMGGDVSLAAGTAGAGNLQFSSILTQGSGNLSFQATNAAGGTITQLTSDASGLSISAMTTGNITVNSLRGTSVALTSNTGSISSTGSSAIQASAELTLSSATGITLNTSASALQASNSTSGNINITQAASPVQTLTITGSGVSNSASGGSISITNLGDSIVVNSLTAVVSSNGNITLAASGLQLSGTVNSGTASTTLANSTAGTMIDVGTNTVGKLSLLQTDLNNVTASVLRIGSATAGSINITTAITNPATWNVLSLINNGTLTEGAGGSLTLPDLRVSSAGPVTLTSANNVGALAAATTNAFSFSNGTHTLTSGAVDGVAGISTANSSVTMIADNLSLSQAVNAGTGIVTLEPFTTSLQINLGSASVPGTSFGLTDGQLGQVTAGVLRIGSASDSGGLTISNPITRHAGFGALTLLNGGTGSQSAALSVANLALQIAGNTVLTNAGNAVDVMAANMNLNFSFTDANSLMIGTVDAIVGVYAGNYFALTAGSAVTQTASIQAFAFELLGGGSYLLGNSNNSVSYFAANITGSVTFTNGGILYIYILSGLGVATATGVTSSTGSVVVSTVTGDLYVYYPVSATAAGRTISLTAGSSSSSTEHILQQFSGQAITANSGVTLSADRMSLGGPISTATGGSNVVQLQATTPGRPLDIDNTGGTPFGELVLTTTELNTVTTDILRLGDLSITGNLTVKSAVGNGTGWSTLSLNTSTAGGISQLAPITVTSLQAAGAQGVSLNNAANNVAILAGAALGAFSFTNSGNLTVGSVDAGLGFGFGTGIMTQGNPITLVLNAANASLSVAQAIHPTAFGAAGGNINITADNMAFSAAVNGGTPGIVTLAPFTTSRIISVGGPNGLSQLGITDALLSNVTGSIVRLGNGSQTGPIRVDASITRHAGYNTLSLIATGAGGAITENAGTLSVANLALAANAGIGAGSSIQVGGPINVAFRNVGGAVGINGSGGVTIAAVDNLSTSSNSGTTTTLAAASPLTFAVNTTSAGAFTASTTETASEIGTPLPPPDDDITVNAGVTVQSSGGSLTLSSADKITIQNGAVVAGFTGLFYNSGVGDNDNDSLSPPSIGETFGASSIILNDTTSLTLKITNSNGNALTGIAFTDSLPAGLIVATPNNLTNTCGGTATATAGSGSVSLTAGGLTGPGFCAVSLNVTATTTGMKTNTTSAVTSTNGGTGNSASASLNVSQCTYGLSSSGTSAPTVGMGGSFNVTTNGGGCTWSALSDSAWLTTSSVGTGNGSVSYTVAANALVSGRSGTITVGGQVYTVTQSGVLPTNLVAAAASTTSISLTWTSDAVDHFEVWRNAGTGYVLLASPTTTSYTDSGLGMMTAYVYKVRAVDSTATDSAFTTPALATTVVFTDDPLVPGVTVIKAVHLTQLRQAVTAASVLAGLGTPTFTDPSLTGVVIKLVHVTELRSDLDAARSALGLPALTYTSITVGSPVSALDITQLRNGVK